MTSPGSPEGLLVAALRARPAVSGPVANRVGTRLSGTYPAIRVTLVGGAARPTASTGQPLLQAECWAAGGEPAHETQAETIALAVEEAGQDLAGTHPAGTIVGSWVPGSLIHSPDPTTGRERYIVQIGLLTQ